MCTRVCARAIGGKLFQAQAGNSDEQNEGPGFPPFHEFSFRLWFCFCDHLDTPSPTRCICLCFGDKDDPGHLGAAEAEERKDKLRWHLSCRYIIAPGEGVVGRRTPVDYSLRGDDRVFSVIGVEELAHAGWW